MNMKRIGIITFIAIIVHGCAPFATLPKTAVKSSEIVGIYSNDCDTTNSWKKNKLWELIDPKYISGEDSLFVKFEITPNNRIKAHLIKDNKILAEKTIKAKLKKDQCYYTRRVFYVVPILPVLWWYSNRQDRIYKIDDTLVFENSFNRGGVIVIMAGGNKGGFIWHYKKK
jgi:hypothetical protein